MNFRATQFRSSAKFGGSAWLGGCSFFDVAEFEAATSTEGIELDGARVRVGESLDHCTWPSGWAAGPVDPDDAGWRVLVRD